MGTQQGNEEYHEKRNRAKEVVKIAKQKSWEEFGKKIEETYKIKE